jgi:hypothetical protein
MSIKKEPLKSYSFETDMTAEEMIKWIKKIKTDLLSVRSKHP